LSKYNHKTGNVKPKKWFDPHAAGIRCVKFECKCGKFLVRQSGIKKSAGLEGVRIHPLPELSFVFIRVHSRFTLIIFLAANEHACTRIFFW